MFCEIFCNLLYFCIDGAHCTSLSNMVKRRLQVCSRFLTVCIVIYRYVLVLHSSLVETSAQKRIFQCLILATIFLLPVLVSSCGVYYRNHYFNYLGQVYSFRGILNPTICLLYATPCRSAQIHFLTSLDFSSLDPDLVIFNTFFSSKNKKK